MKKFFSLVLALVMALSLTTVAWGATTHSVSTAAELIELLDNDGTGDVQNGDVIMLTGNVTFDTTNRSFNSGSYYDGVLYTGGASFTINLGGFTITSDAGALNDYLLNIANKTTATANTITIKNGTLTAVSSVYSALCVGSSAATAPTTVNTENLTINGVHPEGAVVKIRGGSTWNANAGTVVNSNGAYTALECSAATANINAGAKLNQTNSSADPSVGSAIGVSGGGVVNVNGAEIGSDRYGAFVYPTGGTLNVISGTVTAPTALYCDEYTAGYYIADSVINVSGGTITGDVGFRGIDGGDPAISISGGTVEGDILANTGDDLTISGGSFTADVSDYLAPGVVSDGSGNYTTLPSSFTRYTLWDAEVAATATGINYISTNMQLPTVVAAVAPVAPALNGSVAYYTVNGNTYVAGTANDCDIYFTVKGKTTPVMYLKEIGSQNYFAVATKFDNFGKACGQVDLTPAANTEYYYYKDLAGNEYLHAEDTSAYAYEQSTYFLLVNGEMKPIVPTNLYAEVDHSWTFTFNAKGTPVSAKCEDCGATAAVYTKYTAVPAGAKYITEGAYFLVINAPATTDKVTSADTFDAGIAMYVGMSVMAAAGSVVVLKKRED